MDQAVLKLEGVESRYRVDIHGRMVGLEARARMVDFDQQSHYVGEVRDRVCTLDWNMKLVNSSRSGQVAVETPLTGLVILPLHPVNRMTGILPSGGCIGFQSEGTPIDFRNITLTPLPAAKDLNAPMPARLVR